MLRTMEEQRTMKAHTAVRRGLMALAVTAGFLGLAGATADAQPRPGTSDNAAPSIQHESSWGSDYPTQEN